MKNVSEIDQCAYQLTKTFLPTQFINGVTTDLIGKYLNPLIINPISIQKGDAIIAIVG